MSLNDKTEHRSIKEFLKYIVYSYPTSKCKTIWGSQKTPAEDMDTIWKKNKNTWQTDEGQYVEKTCFLVLRKLSTRYHKKGTYENIFFC